MNLKFSKKQKWISGLVGGGLVCVVALTVAMANAPKEKESTTTQSTEQITPKKKTDDSSLSKKEKKKVEEIIKKGDNKLGSTTSGLLGDNYSRSVSTIKDTPVDQVIATKKSSEKKETLVAVANPVEQPKKSTPKGDDDKVAPTPTPKPDPEPNPNPTPDPDPTPNPEPTPDYSQLIAEVNGNADTVKSQANAINTALSAVKNEMNKLNTVGETSSSGVKAAKEQAEKMQKLMDQYNELSKQIKQFIDKNGEIDMLHIDDYKNLYTQLDSVVNELKETNQSMKQVADKVNRSLTEAKQTAASIDTVKETVAQQKANQAVVESNASQTNNTVAEYPAIANSVAEKVTDMNNSVAESASTGTAVDQELATYEANKEQQQSILDQAQADNDTIQELGKSADEQVQQAESDFSSLPKVPQSEPTNEGVTTNETTNSTI